jgi:hypothetical protein
MIGDTEVLPTGEGQATERVKPYLQGSFEG